MFLIVDIIHFPEGDGVVVGLNSGPAPGDGVVVVPLVQNLVSLPCAQLESVSVKSPVNISLKLAIIFMNKLVILFKKTFSALFNLLITLY